MQRVNKKTDEKSNWYNKEQKQLLNGATRLILLAIIDRNRETGIHGYTIAEELEAQTRGEISKSTASFYAVLRRLVDEELVEIKEGESIKGPPRKYYFLTEEGRQVMKALYKNWTYYFSIISEFNNLTGE